MTPTAQYIEHRLEELDHEMPHTVPGLMALTETKRELRAELKAESFSDEHALAMTVQNALQVAADLQQYAKRTRDVDELKGLDAVTLMLIGELNGAHFQIEQRYEALKGKE